MSGTQTVGEEEPTIEELQAEIATLEATISELEAQLQISEAGRISLKASNDALATENTSIKSLIDENTHAQTIMSTAAAALSDEIDTKKNALLDIPDGLSSAEKELVKTARQAEIDELTAKHEKYKQYIRGDI